MSGFVIIVNEDDIDLCGTHLPENGRYENCQVATMLRSRLRNILWLMSTVSWIIHCFLFTNRAGEGKGEPRFSLSRESVGQAQRPHQGH
jgi:hypothetical protein